MRVWAFPSFYPFDRPGEKWSGIFAHRQYKGLINAGAELTVVMPVLWHPPSPWHLLDKGWTRLAQRPYPLQRTYDGISIHHPRISNKQPSSLFKVPFEQRYIASVINFFKKQGVALDPKKDIIYAQWLPEAAKVQKAAHILGLKSAILAIGDDVLIVPGRGMFPLDTFKKVWTEADCRIAVARYLGNEANRRLEVNSPFSVAYRGVEFEKFKLCSSQEKGDYRGTFKLPADKTLILTTGSAILRKGWLDLFDALQQIVIQHPNIALVAVHAGHADLNLDQEASKRGLSNHLINIGEVAPAQMPKMYNAADIFCLPSHSEGIANAVVEALSSGLPVITTNICGHPELIRNQETGILIEPKDTATLTRELSSLLNDAQKRATLGAAARSFIVNEWGSFDTNAKKLYDTLAGCLHGK